MRGGPAIRIKPFFVMEIMERAREMEEAGEDIIHLEIGEPDFETPECIRESAVRAIRSGKTKYTHSRGLPALREAIAAHYAEKYGVPVSPENITVTCGTSAAMSLVFAALLRRGDRVLMPNPSYPCYPAFVRFAGGVPLLMKTEEDKGFLYAPDRVRARLRERKDIRTVILNSPSNPAGQLTPPETMQRIAAMRRILVSDEIYHGLVYGEKERSILEFTNNAFVVNGFSKLYAMTGWRLGYLISPQESTRLIQKLHQNLYISANSFVQWAGITALKEAGPEVRAMVLEYDKRRKALIRGLKKAGFAIAVEPKGAFYVLVNARHVRRDSLALAEQLLEEARVAVTPGIDFGSRTEGFLRFSYTNSLERIEEGMERIGRFLGAVKQSS